MDEPTSGRLTSPQLDAVLAAAAAAPSSHNTQPWCFRVTPEAVEFHGDPARALPAADPDRRELRLACGAALLNMRLTVRSFGRRAHVHLLPEHLQDWFFARLRPGAALETTPSEYQLVRAIPDRRTNREAFGSTPVARTDLAALRRAAEIERTWLLTVDEPARRRRLHELTVVAHRAQRSDPRFVAEWNTWTGRGDEATEGIPLHNAGPLPTLDGGWRVREFAGDARALLEEVRSPAVEEEPLIVAVGTFHDEPLAQLQAGQALQRVLLTATAMGLSASCVAPPLEVREQRAEVRHLLGGQLWPQAVLRLGYGVPVPRTPRRPLAARPAATG